MNGYADSEKNLESLHTLTYPDTNSDDRADYFAKIKIYSLVFLNLKLQRKKKNLQIYPELLTGVISEKWFRRLIIFFIYF